MWSCIWLWSKVLSSLLCITDCASMWLYLRVFVIDCVIFVNCYICDGLSYWQKYLQISSVKQCRALIAHVHFVWAPMAHCWPCILLVSILSISLHIWSCAGALLETCKFDLISKLCSFMLLHSYVWPYMCVFTCVYKCLHVSTCVSLYSVAFLALYCHFWHLYVI